jgi:hypothetical protein
MAQKPYSPLTRMKPGYSCSVLSTLVLIAGCQGLNENPDMPALIVQPDEASQSAVESTLSKIFGGQEVMLADDVFTQSSILSLEHNPDQKLDSQPALGRVITRPLSFQLVKSRDGCFLVDLRDEKRYLLAHTSCTPE